MTTLQLLVEKIIESLVDDIADRCGIGDEWESIDEHMQTEIKQDWARTIKAIIDSYRGIIAE